VAESARTPAHEDTPPVDPIAVDRAYLVHRARRQARLDRVRATRRAGLRFWLVLLGLFVASIVLGFSIWREIERLFGL
jgi:hypothetical protein